MNPPHQAIHTGTIGAYRCTGDVRCTEDMDTTENTPVILTVQDPVELLAYLPYRLGFWPEESAVFFSLRGDPGEPDEPRDPESTSRWQPGLVARVDLADLADPRANAGLRLRADMLSHLRDDEAGVVFLVLYTSEPASLAGAGPGATVARWWLREGIGPDPGRIWVVSGDTYRCLQCQDPPCCPADGHPLRRIAESRIGAEMIFHGMSYAPSRAGLLPQVHVEATTRATAVRAAARWRRRRVLAGPGRIAWLSGLAARWDQALVGGRPVLKAATSDLGALLVGLEEVAVRDAVLLSTVRGTPVLGCLASGGGDLLAEVFSPSGSPPDRQVAARATDILHHLAALAARGRSGEVWAVLGWIAWYEGNGALADMCLQRCLSEDPAHRLGQLIRRAVDHGIPPGWARQIPAA